MPARLNSKAAIAGMTAHENNLLPVTLLTGFLGSGKTTLLNRLLKRPDMAGTAVIINEIGEIGLDHLLIGKTRNEPLLLENGCLCCTARNDLAETLMGLDPTRNDDTSNIRRVVIETTGLADPAPILHLLMTDQAVATRYRLDGVVTAVDAVNGAGTLGRHEEAVKQAAVADRLLVTKTDLATREHVALLHRQLAALNPGAMIVEATDGQADPDSLFGLSLYDAATKTYDIGKWLRADSYDHAGLPACGPLHDHDHCNSGRQLDAHHLGPQIQAFSVVRDRPASWAKVSAWIELLTDMRGDDLLRIKGIVSVAEWPDEPVVIHGVQHIFHPPVRLPSWPSDDRRTRIVFITRHMNRDVIDRTLAVLD